jgi:flagellar motility protein MotE (MotC chaperone)
MKGLIVAVALGAVALGAGVSAYFFFGRPAAKPAVTAKAAPGRAKDKEAKDKEAGREKESAAAAKAATAAKAKDAGTAAKDADAGGVAGKGGPTPAKAPANGETSPTGGSAASATPPPGGAAATDAAAKVPDEIRRLTRLYEGMRPKEAATVLAQLDPELLTTILVTMRERQAAKILALLPAQKAADVSARIARVKPRKDAPADARTARGGRTS